MKNCVICDKEFEAKIPNTKFCGDKCRKTNKLNWQRKYRGNKERVKENKNCKWCKKEFVSYQHSHVFCQIKCGQTYRSRKNEVHGPRRVPRNCIICNQPYMAYSPKHTHCSRKCYNKTRYSRPIERMRNNIRTSLRQSLRYHNVRKTNKTFALLGYTKNELKDYLESLFADGMSWDNTHLWHIDHIRPISSFNFDSTEHPDFKKCWALDNLQPLWANDNLSKGDKWDGVVNA